MYITTFLEVYFLSITFDIFLHKCKVDKFYYDFFCRGPDSPDLNVI